MGGGGMNKRIAEFLSNLAGENDELEQKVKYYHEKIESTWEALCKERELVKALKRNINALKKKITK